MGPVAIVIIAIALGLVSLPIAAIIDALRRPAIQWTRVGLNRLTWVLLMSVGTVLGVGVLGVVAAIEYLISVRPKLEMAAEMGGDLT
ncbi:MAG TPA: hypothetical protein VHF24_01870 [Acidimicrobiales bacterium]|jgi:hypothetical protein|nr:hypothetical protein [Acidimicrobiales bacterium]